MTASSLILSVGLATGWLAQLQFQVVPVQLVGPATAAPASPSANVAPATGANGAVLSADVVVNLRSAALDPRLVQVGAAEGSIEPSEAGLKLAVNRGHAKRAATGVKLPLRLCGDFEVTLAYEELAVHYTTAGDRGAGMSLAVAVPGSTPGETTRAVLHRLWSFQSKQRNLVAEKITERGGGMQLTEQSTPAATSSRRARMRLVRTGGELRFLIAEADSVEFRELRRIDFPTGDAAEIEVVVHNGTGQAQVTAVVVELAAKATKLGGAGPVVTTIHGESLSGKPAAIEGATLLVDGPQGKKIPLDEVLSIDLDRALADSAAQPTAADPAAVVLYLESGDRLLGSLRELTADAARIMANWGSEIEVPLARLSGIEFTANQTASAETAGSTDNKDSKTGGTPANAAAPAVESAADRWRRELAQPAETDTVLVRARDGAITTVSGAIQAIRDDKLEFLYEGQVRNIDRARLLGLVFAAHPSARADRSAFQRFHLSDGQRIAGRWLAISADAYELETSWQARWQIPAQRVREITSHNGRMTHLSDLEPAAVEQVPYFGRVRPYQRDRGITGGGLRIGDESYAKGLAVHSRTVLTYAIDGAFSQFQATIGFDPAAGKQGRVACRVLGDGRELFADADLRADEPPAVLDLSVAGVSTLVLEVDFGEAEDAGDDVVWGRPRLYREPSEQPAS